MRGLIAGVLLAAFTAGSGAYAEGVGQPQSEEGMICLETNGAEGRSLCRRGDAWHDADVCTCETGMRFRIPVCGPGERPAPDSVAADRVRREAMRRGTLYGATYEGRQMCVDVHHPRSNTYSPH